VKGRTVLITGGSDGIGFAAAEALALRQAKVFLLGRNPEKTEKAVKKLREGSGNPNIDFFLADLSSQKSIRQTAAVIRGQLERLDVLINNAGGIFPRFALSEDGLELTIATNHLAPFLLTHLLLDRLLASPDGRIITVTSAAHYYGSMDFARFRDPKRYHFYRAYAQSKLANVLFTHELAERLQGSAISVNCVHPGVVRTRIGNKNTPVVMSIGWTLFALLFGISSAKGAETVVYLASSDDVRGVSGGYYARCRKQQSSSLSHDKDLATKLWQISEELTATSPGNC
jgi:NAD(P)-dependent dehydrogenase (short-subunit alcohol dehydrogenase family)